MLAIVDDDVMPFLLMLNSTLYSRMSKGLSVCVWGGVGGR